MINSFVLRNVDLNTLMNDKDTERDPIKQNRECFEIKKLYLNLTCILF